jgi:hypothetical protein
MSRIRVPNFPYFHVVLIVNGRRYQKSAKTASRAQAKAFARGLQRAPHAEPTITGGANDLQCIGRRDSLRGRAPVADKHPDSDP